MLSMHMKRTARVRWVWATTALIAAGCASGADDAPATGDGGAGVEAGPADAGAGEEDAGSGRRDAGDPLECPDGQHLCGGGCIDDQPNEPENGCRLGCGEPCPTTEFEVASCAEDGTCTFECEPPSVREGDACVCDAATCESLGAMCGTLDDGCGGTLECGTCADGTECIDGGCGCPPDEGEPNESRLSPHDLPAFTDAPDTSMTFDAFTMSSDSDEDWFTFEVTDECCDGNPDIDVTLRSIPSGGDYDLAVWFVCSSGGDDSACARGAVDNSIGRGCMSSSSGSTEERVTISTSCGGTTSENGTVYVRVTSTTWAGSCAPYGLTVSVQ